MQWKTGLYTEARLTQRSLFKSIYNIFKVIFSLNKRLHEMWFHSVFLAWFFCFVLFWLLKILFCCFSNGKTPYFCRSGTQAGTLHLKLPLAGFLGGPGEVYTPHTHPRSVTKNQKQLCLGKMGLFWCPSSEAGGLWLPDRKRPPELLVTPDVLHNLKWEHPF